MHDYKVQLIKPDPVARTLSWIRGDVSFTIVVEPSTPSDEDAVMAFFSAFAEAKTAASLPGGAPSAEAPFTLARYFNKIAVPATWAASLPSEGLTAPTTPNAATPPSASRLEPRTPQTSGTTPSSTLSREEIRASLYQPSARAYGGLAHLPSSASTLRTYGKRPSTASTTVVSSSPTRGLGVGDVEPRPWGRGDENSASPQRSEQYSKRAAMMAPAAASWSASLTKTPRPPLPVTTAKSLADVFVEPQESWTTTTTTTAPSPTIHRTPLTSSSFNHGNTFAPTATTSSSARAGIRNVGNSCYSNAVLQALASEPLLLADLSSPLWAHVAERAKVTRALQATLDAASSTSMTTTTTTTTTARVVDPTSLKRALPPSSFSQKHNQEDAHEYLCALVDACESELAKGSVGEQLWESLESSLPDFVRQFTANVPRADLLRRVLPFRSLYSELEKEITCVSCGYARTVSERHLTHSLDFDGALPLEEDAWTLEEMWTRYLGLPSGRVVEYRCEQAGCGGTRARLVHRVLRLPDVLVLHVKRFVVRMGPPVTTRKLSDRVAFPATLTLPTTCLAKSVAATRDVGAWPDLVTLDAGVKAGAVGEAASAPSVSATYELRSAVLHVGREWDFGHYKTLARTATSQSSPDAWTEFDDSWVSPLRGGVADVVKSPAHQREVYLLFYDRLSL